MRVKKHIKIKWKNLLSLVIAYISIVLIITSSIKIIKWKLDSNNTKEQTTNINEPKEIIDNKNEEIIEQEEIPKENPYWDYIKMNLIDVDITELKKKNSEVIGWIQLNGTNINYPFVQTSDNQFYLDHSLDKSKNSAGWVFMDYRNDIRNDKNIILYAHSRWDNTMFGTLKNILSSNWVNNPNNYVLKMVTEDESTLWQVFSIYRIPTTSDYLQVDFSSDENYQALLNTLINRSQFNFNTTINEKDHILTLSTCYGYDTERVVLHAKLIKRKQK